MATGSLTAAQQAFLEEHVMKPAAAPAPRGKGAAGLLAQAAKLEARLAALPPAAQALVTKPRAAIAAAVAEAQKAGPDTEDAAKALAPFADDIRRLSGDLPVIQTYVTEAARFGTRLQQARNRKGGKGGIAIADYIARLDEDERRRAAAEARGDIRMALVAVEARDHLHDAMMQEAERGAEYVALTAALEAEIGRLEHLAPGGGDARPAIEEVRGMMVDAGNFTKSGNWVGAVMMLRKARTALRVGTRGLELSQTLDKAAQAPDFEGAQRTFATLFKRIGGTKGAGTFAADLRAAKAQADAAAQALPDMARARAGIDEAIAACRALTGPLMQQARYRATLRTVLDQHAALAGLNLDGCIDAEIKRAAARIKAASTQAKARDFTAALATLDSAGDLVARAHAAGAAYCDLVRNGRLELARAIQRAGPQGDTGPLRAVFDRLSAAFAKRDLQSVPGLAQEAQDLARAT